MLFFYVLNLLFNIVFNSICFICHLFTIWVFVYTVGPWKLYFKQTSNESYWQALDQMVAYMQKPTFDYGYEMYYLSATALESEVLFIQKHVVIIDKFFLCFHSWYCVFYFLFIFRASKVWFIVWPSTWFPEKRSTWT